ncbi:hypothetical protein ACPA5B_03450 [Pseudomonas solani]|uniref:hypothetical protein n=1 Tax=Pseudomonas solani TaxID=2731552 RepID=UPI003C2D253C
MDALSDDAPQGSTTEQKKSTVSQEKVESYLSGFGGSKFQPLFAILQASGLEPLGKSNTDTLLFQLRDGAMAHDVVAFRRKPEAVLSFPKSYWATRAADRAALCKSFDLGEQPAVTKEVGSTSQQSAGQVKVSAVTLERLVALCTELRRYVSAKAD